MSIQIQARVSVLESEVKALRQTVNDLIAMLGEAEAAQPAPRPNGPQALPPMPPGNPNPQGPRQMCPKCGEKPAYNFHVMHCTGPRRVA